eukprot:1360618-Pyramimonas_sp.AAC.1
MRRQRPALMAIAAAWVVQIEFRVGGLNDCASNGVDNFKFGLAKSTAQILLSKNRIGSTPPLHPKYEIAMSQAS